MNSDYIEKVGTVVQFLNLLNYEKYDYSTLFRGQANKAWKLSPSLERSISTVDQNRMDPMNWAELEDELLDDFKLYAAPHLDRIPENKLEWLVQAQHHGLPTVLLDLTTNPLKALFFAVEATEHDNVDGAVFFAFGDFESVLGLNDITPECGYDYNRCFYPRHINNRITAQDSCFFLYPLPPKFEPFGTLSEEYDHMHDAVGIHCKVIIPKECKVHIRRELERLGITPRTIYPGLDGITKSIKQKLSDGSTLSEKW